MVSTVETTEGVVRGEVVDGVARFLGIPYAAPPVGPLRWRPPQSPCRRDGELEANRFGPTAPQLGAGSSLVDRVFRPIRGASAEDCLYLNVWMPTAAGAGGDGRGRPLVVWFHGGGFVLGAGSTFLYEGTTLARDTGAIVVTLNYRLGALGFLDLRAVDDRAEPTANLGLRDQIAAVDWLRANAERFGGDPARITLVGESAGAMSLGCLVAARPGLAARFILQSGAADHVSDRTHAGVVAETFLEAVKLEATDGDGLRRLSVEEILRAQRTSSFRNVSSRRELPWQPTIGDALLPAAPLELAEGRGDGPRPDVIVGTNRDEWRLFANPGVHLRALSDRALERRVVRLLELAEGEAEALLELYRLRSDGTERSAFDVWTALRTDEFFRAPAVDLADRLTARGDRVYVYRFDFPVPALRRSFGACHAVEVPLLFGTHGHLLLRHLYGNAPGTERAACAIRKRWGAFAEGGAPDAAHRWPPHGPDRPTLLLAEGGRVVSDPEPERRRWWQALRARRRADAGVGSGPADRYTERRSGKTP